MIQVDISMDLGEFDLTEIDVTLAVKETEEQIQHTREDALHPVNPQHSGILAIKARLFEDRWQALTQKPRGEVLLAARGIYEDSRRLTEEGITEDVLGHRILSLHPDVSNLSPLLRRTRWGRVVVSGAAAAEAQRDRGFHGVERR